MKVNFLIGQYSGSTHAGLAILAGDSSVKGQHHHYHLVWKIYCNYWCCNQKNILKVEVRRIVSSTLPIRLNMAYSIGSAGVDQKRKQKFSRFEI
jgi:hypothetical protein